MTQLTKNFRLDEFTRSATAARLGISNEPSPEHLENIKYIADRMEIVRRILGNNPIKVSSGYRSPRLNASLPGTAAKSAHMEGRAVDFTCSGFGTPTEIVRELGKHFDELNFDRIIDESGAWVHIDFKPKGQKGRNQLMKAKNAGTKNTTYHPFV
jgi:hypothetical protein